ncbi:MAG: sulfatase [Bacteroidota bacterium]
MDKKPVLTLLIVIFTKIAAFQAIAGGNPGEDRLEEKSPNIVFIMADDLGFADINCFDPLNRSYYETPNIDRLAQQGMKFTQAYTNAANSAPTRAALISGQYYPNQPIYHVGSSGPGEMIPAPNADKLPKEKIADAEILKKAGYTNALIGKWHLGDPTEFGPKAQGYDVNVGGYNAGNPGVWEGGYFRPDNNPYINDAGKEEYLTDYLTRKAIGFIEDHKEGPFYLNLSFYTPHSPFQAPAEIVEKYEQKEPDRGHNHATYAAMIEIMDRNVGKIMDALETAGISDNTMLIFYSDNGGRGGYGFLGHEENNVTSNAPLKGGKGTFYEGGIRVPMIVRWPGLTTPGSTSDEPVISIDFYPTYLEAAGIEQSKDYQLDGKSLLPLLKDPDQTIDRNALYWHFPGYPNNPWRTTPVSVIRSGPWKLMKFYETGEIKLYNLDKDQGEEHNLAEDRPQVRDKLIHHLEQWLEENDAPLPEFP